MLLYTQPLIRMSKAGPALSASTTPTSLLDSSAKFTMPANLLVGPGDEFYISGMGQISNIVTTPGTFTLDFRLGGTVVYNSGAMQLSTTAHTTLPFWFEIWLTCRAIGSAANFMGQGKFISQALNISSSDSATGHSVLLAPNSTPTVGNSFDSTAAQQADVFGTFSINNAANAFTLQQYRLLALQ